MYSIYLTETAKKEIQTIQASKINSILERLTLLEKGHWKNGTRVKKLRSVNKLPIYEARVDKGNRMLFTLVPITEWGKNKTAIMIFHLSVAHDAVVRTAKNIIGASFTEQMYEEAEEAMIDTIVSLEEESKKWWYPQYYAPFVHQKMYAIDEETFIRFMQKEELAPEEFWNMKLKLTDEQFEVLEKPLPVLMSGTAGSGKTTIVIHKLLCEPNLKKLYLTYNKALAEEAQKQFESLIRGLDEEETYRRNTSFSTFAQIFNFYKDDEFQTIITKEKFIFEYTKYARNNKLTNTFPPLMIWEEIRGVLKSGAFSKAPLTVKQYKKLTKHQAPNFYGKRDQAYKIFEWYEEWLANNYYLDEQDILRVILEKDLPTFDIVICDEVQDVSILHIDLVLALANNEPNRVILTGDDHQIIQYSGFRWENIKTLFYEKFNCAIQEIVQLSKNFRNSGKIAKLAAAINHLQRNYTDFQYKTKETEHLDFGTQPLLYQHIDITALLEKISTFGAHDAILVRNDEERKQLKTLFANISKQSPLIFTVSESKGLEFSSIMLWNMFKEELAESKQWQKIKRLIDQGNVHRIDENTVFKRFIRYEASLLYVAVTRGIKNCFIFEHNEQPAFWQIDDIAQSLSVRYTLDDRDIEEQASTDEDWLNQGMLLLNKKLYDLALECFNRVPAEKGQHYITLCEAFIAKNNGEYLMAAEKFKAADVYEEALTCFDACGEYQKAQRLCDYVMFRHKSDKQLEMKWEYLKSAYKVKEFDQKQYWVGGAIYCQRIGKYLEAIKRFEKDDPNVETNRNLFNLYNQLTSQQYIDPTILDKAIAYYQAINHRERADYLSNYKQFAMK